MALTWVNPVPSRQLVAQLIANAATPRDWVVKLYTNDVTPAVGSPSGGSTAATFTEASGGGYASVTLAGGSWTASDDGVNDGVLTYNSAVTWTFTGTLSGGASIYGVYVVQATSGLLLLAARETAAPIPVANGTVYTIPSFKFRVGDITL